MDELMVSRLKQFIRAEWPEEFCAPRPGQPGYKEWLLEEAHAVVHKARAERAAKLADGPKGRPRLMLIQGGLA